MYLLPMAIERGKKDKLINNLTTVIIIENLLACPIYFDCDNLVLGGVEDNKYRQ